MYYTAVFQITNTLTGRIFSKKVCLLTEDKEGALFEAYDAFEQMRQDLGYAEWRLIGPTAITITAH